jgi:hypothetical protein
MHTHADTCSCGEAADHIIAKRRTSDGKTVLVWSDGVVTFGFGFRVNGAGRARQAYVRRLNVEAGWIVADVAELVTSDELPRAVELARLEVRADFRTGTAIDRARIGRRILAALSPA